jgi:hypothetical protein
MTASARGTYTAICERVGKWWEITVPELDEVTQARGLEDVYATVADLVALMTDADPATVKVNLKLPQGPNLAAAEESGRRAEVLALITGRWGSLKNAPDFIRTLWDAEGWPEDLIMDAIATYITRNPAQEQPGRRHLRRA